MHIQKVYLHCFGNWIVLKYNIDFYLVDRASLVSEKTFFFLVQVCDSKKKMSMACLSYHHLTRDLKSGYAKYPIPPDYPGVDAKF